MRLGLLGDVHAEDERLATGLEMFAHERLDMILCAGDIVDGRGDLLRTITLLRDANVVSVRGNHDRWIAADRMRDLPDAHELSLLDGPAREWISSLPATRTFETPLGPLLLCHGIGDDDMARLLPEDEGYAVSSLDTLQALLTEDRVRVIVGGHTHQRMVRRFGDLVFVNAGTLRSGNDPCVGILDLVERNVRFYDFESRTVLVPGETFPLEPDVFPV
jgi:putative phosphoesterase